mgnify:CR=1 FL=1
MPAECRDTDILVKDGRICRIADNISCDDARVVNASGKYVFPGFIDTHTHLSMATAYAHTADDFASGTRAALIGGTTTILDFATQDKGMTLSEALDSWHKLANGCSSCNYGFHMAITDWNEETRREMTLMKENGITSFKVYMAYDALKCSDREIFEIMSEAEKIGGLVSAHCENGDLVNALVQKQKDSGCLTPAAHPLSRPDFVESEAVGRFLTIAEAAGAPAYVVHLSSRRGLEVCLAARARGQKLFIETCPQYMVLDDSCYRLAGFESAKYVFAPPARKQRDIRAITEAVADGTVETIGSDHCSFNMNGGAAGGKEAGLNDFSLIPNGIPGVETRPALMQTIACEQKIGPGHLNRILSENAARIFGMYPRKGCIAEGSDADLVIWDQDHRGVISAAAQTQKVDYNPYEGKKIKGRAETVILNGEIAVSGGKIVLGNSGKYVFRHESGR